MHKTFKRFISTIALAMSFLLCSNTTLVFADANSLSIGKNSKESTSQAGYNVTILYEDTNTRIAKSVDSKEVTLVSFDKMTQQSKMIILPLNADTKKGSSQDFINLFKRSSSALSDEVSQKFELKASPAYNTSNDISVQSLSDQSVSLFFSDLSYAYFGQYSLTNTKNSNVRIAGADVQKDAVLYTEVNNFRQQLNALKGIESDSRFEAAGAVIATLLAIPDITVSKIAAVLVAAGVVITSANLIYNYVVGTHDADGYYADVLSRCKSIGVRYW